MRQLRGNSLVGLLVTVAIMALLAVVLFKGSGAFGGKATSARKDGKGTTVLGQVQYDAKDTVCRSNLGQVRASLLIQQSANDEKFPESIESTNLGKDFYQCPLGKEKYVYDPTTGKVYCPHPGHEKF